MITSAAVLRLNLGDPSEGRVYYLPHFLAAEVGHFAAQRLDVRFQRTPGGGHTAMGGQIGPVVNGEADACVGGPMVTMKLQEQGHAEIVSFCALVPRNPWIVASCGEAVSCLSQLGGKTIIDAGNVATATLCLRDALASAGVADRVKVEPGSGDLAADVALAQTDPNILIHHSLHALGPAVARRDLRLALSMATVTPRVPWSAYIARKDVIAAHPDLFVRFRCGIEAALLDVANMPAAAIAARIAHHYPDYPTEALTMVIEAYRNTGCFAPDARIACQDMQAFATIMHRAGWLERLPRIEDLLDRDIAA